MQLQHFNNWHSAHYGLGGVSAVPARAGVYAVVRVPRLHGLPQAFDALYVGKAVNLKRRLC